MNKIEFKFDHTKESLHEATGVSMDIAQEAMKKVEQAYKKTSEEDGASNSKIIEAINKCEKEELTLAVYGLIRTVIDLKNHIRSSSLQDTLEKLMRRNEDHDIDQALD